MIAVGLAGIPYYARTAYAAALVETASPISKPPPPPAPARSASSSCISCPT